MELVEKFTSDYGRGLTIGGTALKILRNYHPFDNTHLNHDDKFRPYYYGGRTQCFEGGTFRGNFVFIDVNSMYPYVMSELNHPIGTDYIHTNDPDTIEKILNPSGKWKTDRKRPFFITIWCHSKGHLPKRTKTELSFPVGQHIFKLTHHEFQIALKHKLISNILPLEIWIARKTIKFKDYVDIFMQQKIKGKTEGITWLKIFAKTMLTSPYGKLAANPRKYFDWFLVNPGEKRPTPRKDNNPEDKPKEELWDRYGEIEGVELWRKPLHKSQWRFYDVACAASITGASRAVLMDALVKTKRPLYCDTDSILCEGFKGLEIDKYKLGAWDIEAQGDTAAIAGKKLYTLLKNGKPIKQANKGVKFDSDQIIRVAKGETITYLSDTPTTSLTKPMYYIERIIKATVPLNNTDF
jgi:DNA polymerase elongation subunit (family B)